MKYGFVLPYEDARKVADMAYKAEQAGWERARVSRMRPWKLASETATLDRLSNGRVILSVGLGALDTGFKEFGEVTSREKRIGLVDEGIDILTGLWKGPSFSYEGKTPVKERDNGYDTVSPYYEAGATWWIEAMWDLSSKDGARASTSCLIFSV